MKTVFIFGAGASRQAGAPLMSDFLDKSEELFRSGQLEDTDDRVAFIDVFKAISDLRAIHQKAYLNLDNFEILFGAIEMGNLTGKLANRDRDNIVGLRKSITTLIVKTLEHTIQFPRSEGKVMPPRPYHHFIKVLIASVKASRPIKPQLSFLTFNYDLALDYALHFARGWIKYDYCLTERPSLNTYPLLKLHGSINWGVCVECKKIIPYDFADVGMPPFFGEVESPFYFNLGTNIDRKQHCGKPLKRTPVLVPPTWNKTGYHEDLAHVWNQASQELAEAENIFVIGYSLPETDSFFRYLYALGSESETRIKRFWVFNPDETVEPRFKELIGRGIENRFRFFHGQHGTFDSAIPVIEGELKKIL